MEVMLGPTFGIDVSAPAYVKDSRGITAQDKAVSAALLLGDQSGRVGTQIGLRKGRNSPEESSESSSSIGEPEDSSDDEGEDDAVSSKGGLGTFSSLQDSLPINCLKILGFLPAKSRCIYIYIYSHTPQESDVNFLILLQDQWRGLSNHYAGKSKSFANLSEVSDVKEMEKSENPFNKRRRVLMASKMRSRRSSSSSSLFFYSLQQNPKSMPLLPLQETTDENDQIHMIKTDIS